MGLAKTIQAIAAAEILACSVTTLNHGLPSPLVHGRAFSRDDRAATTPVSILAISVANRRLPEPRTCGSGHLWGRPRSGVDTSRGTTTPIRPASFIVSFRSSVAGISGRHPRSCPAGRSGPDGGRARPVRSPAVHDPGGSSGPSSPEPSASIARLRMSMAASRCDALHAAQYRASSPAGKALFRFTRNHEKICPLGIGRVGV